MPLALVTLRQACFSNSFFAPFSKLPRAGWQPAVPGRSQTLQRASGAAPLWTTRRIDLVPLRGASRCAGLPRSRLGRCALGGQLFSDISTLFRFPGRSCVTRSLRSNLLTSKSPQRGRRKASPALQRRDQMPIFSKSPTGTTQGEFEHAIADANAVPVGYFFSHRFPDAEAP